ncbi:MAG: hypothetical protein SPG13_00960 [Peptostreptococcus porci]|uniref:Phage abortive infection protein n=1 Tax=Peptostreptococcus porci TaxID=2652282 RepID=A0A6N7X1Q1_9FIRM|nr:hypothetical protein [Peptostreptococcus porci]MDY5479008.1 hypothetical protein [Peptostreptococcus porci]MST63075.1 hypothetical protein [Peptostreptococcus porci]
MELMKILKNYRIYILLGLLPVFVSCIIHFKMDVNGNFFDNWFSNYAEYVGIVYTAMITLATFSYNNELKMREENKLSRCDSLLDLIKNLREISYILMRLEKYDIVQNYNHIGLDIDVDRNKKIEILESSYEELLNYIDYKNYLYYNFYGRIDEIKIKEIKQSVVDINRIKEDIIFIKKNKNFRMFLAMKDYREYDELMECLHKHDENDISKVYLSMNGYESFGEVYLDIEKYLKTIERLILENELLVEYLTENICYGNTEIKKRFIEHINRKKKEEEKNREEYIKRCNIES